MNDAVQKKSATLFERYGAWAVVTGASEGIGRAFSMQLARSGMNLILVARRTHLLEELSAEIRKHCGVEVRIVPVDLTQAEGAQRLLEATRALEVGVLVAAAGFGTSGHFIEGELDEELAMIDLNCRAVATLAYHFGRRFAARGRGALVLMSSLLAFQGVPRAANYAATKAYVQSLAEGLRRELKPLGVDVIASAPGPIASGFAKRARMTMSMAGSAESVAAGTLRALGRTAIVRPGFLSKFLEFSLAFLPRWGRVRILARVMAGMTKARA